MSTLHLMIGIPGSGKSTYVNKLLKTNYMKLPFFKTKAARKHFFINLSILILLSYYRFNSKIRKLWTWSMSSYMFNNWYALCINSSI